MRLGPRSNQALRLPAKPDIPQPPVIAKLVEEQDSGIWSWEGLFEDSDLESDLSDPSTFCNEINKGFVGNPVDFDGVFQADTVVILHRTYVAARKWLFSFLVERP